MRNTLIAVAALFLIYIDAGICGACIYFGIISEFYMWLAAVRASTAAAHLKRDQ